MLTVFRTKGHTITVKHKILLRPTKEHYSTKQKKIRSLSFCRHTASNITKNLDVDKYFWIVHSTS